MRSNKLYLTDILEATEAINRFLSGYNKTDFINDELRQSGVLQKLIVIGEAASRLPDTFKSNYTVIPWRDITAFRNLAVHAYFSIDIDIVWETATSDVPILQKQVQAILAKGLRES